MNNSVKFTGALLIVAFLYAFTTINSGLKPLWEVAVENQDGPHDPVTSIHFSPLGQTVIVMNPLGLEVFNVQGQKLAENSNTKKKSVKKKSSGKSFLKGMSSGGGDSKGITIGGGKSKKEPQEPLQKIVYLHLEHTNAVLEFNYGSGKETISLISIENCLPLWTNSSLDWSPEFYQYITNLLSDQIASSSSVDFSRKMGVGVAAGIFFPNKYIENIATVLPGKNAVLVNTLMDGVASLNLTNGEVNWISSASAGGLSHIMLDEASNSIVTLGGNPFWFPDVLNAAQTNKKMVRIDLNTGNTIWESQYNKNFITKNHGGFEYYDKPDARIVDNKILLNFNETEIFDFETGQSLFITDGSKESLMTWGGTIKAASSFFGLPLIDDKVLYRSYVTKVLAFGVSTGGDQVNNHEIVVEALNVDTGEQLWVSGPYSRAGVNNMTLWNDYLLIGMDGREGVKALDRKTGKLIWEHELGRRGVTSRWHIENNQLLFAEHNTLHLLDLTSGNPIRTIDVRQTTGNIKELYLENNRLTIIGKKDGIAIYDLNNGELVNSIKIGYYPIIERYTDRILVSSYDPTEPFFILNSESLDEMGSLSKSRHRTALSWSDEGRKVFEISRGKLIKYSL